MRLFSFYFLIRNCQKEYKHLMYSRGSTCFVYKRGKAFEEKGTREPGRQCFSVSHIIELSLSEMKYMVTTQTNVILYVWEGRRKHIDSKTYVLCCGSTPLLLISCRSSFPLMLFNNEFSERNEMKQKKKIKKISYRKHEVLSSSEYLLLNNISIYIA